MRNGYVQALLDNRLISRWDTDYADMGCWDGFSRVHENRLAVGCYDAQVIFHSIEVREISGRGKSFRRPIAGQPEPVRSGDPFVQEVSALAGEAQFNRVISKLQELNPGFSGQATHQIQDGVLIGLELSSLAISDISPICHP